MATQYIGTCDNQLQAEGGKTVADTITRKVVYKGKRTTMEAFQSGAYNKGQIFQIEWMILSSDLQILPGDMAKLTLNLVQKGGTTTDNYPDEIIGGTVWEINWNGVEKPLTSNPNSKLFGAYKGVTGDANETQRQEKIDEIEAWRNSPQQRKRKYQIPLSTLTREAVAGTDADWEEVSAEAKKFCQKIAAGVEGYMVYAPVITKTSVHSLKPYTGGCGKINTPEINIVGYVYLKNGDRAVQQQDKTWQRVQSWQGAETIDTDLYDTE